MYNGNRYIKYCVTVVVSSCVLSLKAQLFTRVSVASAQTLHQRRWMELIRRGTRLGSDTPSTPLNGAHSSRSYDLSNNQYKYIGLWISFLSSEFVLWCILIKFFCVPSWEIRCCFCLVRRITGEFTPASIIPNIITSSLQIYLFLHTYTKTFEMKET